MVLTGGASPVNGAPGAVILYALLAVLLWPADRGAAAPFTAARAVGAPVARALWLVLWLSLAYFALLPANRAPQALHDMIAGMEDGEPGWLAALDSGRRRARRPPGTGRLDRAGRRAGDHRRRRVPAAPAAKGTLVLAIVVAAVIWVFGEAFGAILAGGATDPNSGPLLALLALTYWPVRTAVTAPARTPGPQRAKGRPHHDPLLDPGHLRRGHARRRGGERGPPGRGAAVAAGASGAALADIDVAHLLMAIAMAGMLAASLQTLPNGAWEVIFGVLTAWFAYRVAPGCAGQRRPRAGGRALRAAPHPRRGDAVHVPRPDRPRGARLGRHERHGRAGRRWGP